MCGWDNDRPTKSSSRSAPPKVLIRSIFLDHRSRHAHKNATVFLLEAEDLIIRRNLIVGCEVDGRRAAAFKLRDSYKNPFIRYACPRLTHGMAAFDCFDLPVTNGTTNAVLHFRSQPRGPVESATSLEPLVFPAPHVKGKNSRFSIVACIAVQYGIPPFLEEAIHYHHTIGVDHVHIVAEPSIYDGGALELPFVKESLESGFVSLSIYKPLLSKFEIFDHSQTLAYHQCYLRYLGTYDYIYYADADDFFVPRVPEHKTLDYYIENWCVNGSCRFEWHQYYTHCGLKPGTPEDGNVTAMLVSTVSKVREVGKEVHHLIDLLDIGTHRSGDLLVGREYAVPPDIAIVAHVPKDSKRFAKRVQC